MTPREMFSSAGKYGFLGMAVPEQYGGGGTARLPLQPGDRRGARPGRHRWVGSRAHAPQRRRARPYFLEYCNEEQAQRWLPGHRIGRADHRDRHDRAGHRLRPREHDHHGHPRRRRVRAQRFEDVHHERHQRDLVIVAAKTDPTQRHTGMSLIVVERGMPGFERGRKLEKLGMHSQDTAELFFTDCRVPVGQPARRRGQGVLVPVAQPRPGAAVDRHQRCRQRPRRARVDRRLRQGAQGVRHARSARSRTPSSCSPQVKTEVDVAQAYIDQCVLALNAGTLTRGRGGAGQALRDRPAEALDRPVPAVVRRLRLHARVPDRPRLRRRPSHVDLRRHQRGDEDDHRQDARALTRRCRHARVTASVPARPRSDASPRVRRRRARRAPCRDRCRDRCRARPSGGPPRRGGGAAGRASRGSHQLRSPSSSMVAGTSTIRTTVASSSTADGQPEADQLESTGRRGRRRRTRATMMAAAAVMTRAVQASPGDRRGVVAGARYSSRMRESRNTS